MIIQKIYITLLVLLLSGASALAQQDCEDCAGCPPPHTEVAVEGQDCPTCCETCVIDGFQNECPGGEPIVFFDDQIPSDASGICEIFTAEHYPLGGNFTWDRLLGGGSRVTVQSGPNPNFQDAPGDYEVIYTTKTGCSHTFPFQIIPVDNQVVVHLFEDTNFNGQDDDGNPLVAIGVELIDDATKEVVFFDTSNGVGDIFFDDMLIGNYFLRLQFLPPGTTCMDPNPPNNEFDPITLTTPVFPVNDFGPPIVFNGGVKPIPPVVIFGTCWVDENGNGINDINEPPLPGATVRIFSPTPGTGDIVLETDEFGNYSHPWFPPFGYPLVIDFDPPAQEEFPGFTLQDVGGNDLIDSDVNANGQFQLPVFPPTTNNIKIDAGVTKTSVIRVTVIGILTGAERNDGEMGTELDQGGFLPTNEPYSGLGYTVDNPLITLFPPNVSNPVDWVTVELRDKNDSTVVIASKAAIITKDGKVVDPETGGPVTFEVPHEIYFVALRHRNHLDIMTKFPVFLDDQDFIVDFTDPNTPTTGFEPQKELDSGLLGLWGGDANGDGTVQPSDKNGTWKLEVGQSNYLQGDFNLDGNVQPSDKNEIFVPNVGKSSAVE